MSLYLCCSPVLHPETPELCKMFLLIANPGIFLTVLVVVGLSPTVSSQLDPVTQQAIDDLVQDEFFTKANVSALGLSIVKDGQVLYSTGYGHREIETNIPADNETLFLFGSIGKSVTATIAIKFLSEKFPELGEKVLDTSIHKLVPSYNFTLSDRYRSVSVTFRDLLSHRVGESLPYFLLQYGTINDPKEFAYRLRYAEEEYPFRNNFLYNNAHFALAADVLSEMSGLPFLSMVDTFFSELGMTSSSYVKETDDHDQMPNRAVGYYWMDGEQHRYNSELYKTVVPMIAAGGYFTSPNDMAKYLLFHLNLGRIGDTQVIPEEVMKWMRKNSNPDTPQQWKSSPEDKEYLPLGYGLGFTLNSYDGWQVVQHGGFLPPFYSLLNLYPGLNLGIFSTASSTGAFPFEVATPHNALHLYIFELLQGNQRRNIGPVPSTLTTKMLNYPSSQPLTIHSISENSTFIPQPSQAGDFIGSYGNGFHGEVIVSNKTNEATGEYQLFMQFGKWGYGWLTEVELNTYSFEVDSDVRQMFYAQGYFDPLIVTVTFDGSTKLTYNQSGIIVVFEKNLEWVNLPKQPWDSNSCGPVIQ